MSTTDAQSRVRYFTSTLLPSSQICSAPLKITNGLINNHTFDLDGNYSLAKSISLKPSGTNYNTFTVNNYGEISINDYTTGDQIFNISRTGNMSLQTADGTHLFSIDATNIRHYGSSQFDGSCQFDGTFKHSSPVAYICNFEGGTPTTQYSYINFYNNNSDVNVATDIGINFKASNSPLTYKMHLLKFQQIC